MDRIMNYFYYLNSHFESFPLVIRITVVLTLLLGGLYMLSLLRIGLVAYGARLEVVRRKKVTDKYALLLYDLLYNEEDKTGTQVKVYLGLVDQKLKNWEKACITDLLMKMTKGEHEVQYK